MNSRRGLGQILMLTALAMTWGCSQSKTATREVAGRTFAIPREYLVEATVFYLPASQNRALRFVINPAAPLPQQNMVSFHPDATCPPISSLHGRDPDCRIVPIPLSRLEEEKLRRVGDNVWWEYRFEKSGEPVAFCSALEKGEGLCSHYGLYDGLPYSIGLRDSQMDELIGLRRATEQKLSEWEIEEEG